MRVNPTFSTLLVAGLLALACSHTSSQTGRLSSKFSPQDTEMTPTEFNQKYRFSSLEIEYLLDRDRYRLNFQGNGERVTVASYHEGKIVETGQIQLERYSPFLKKALSAFGTLKKETAGSNPCANPYVLTLKVADQTEKVTGCRSQDPINMSKLIRDGEFLLYSKIE